MQEKRRLHHAIALILYAGLLAYWLQADYFGMEILAEIAILAILGMSLDLLAGYTGLVSLGSGAFFGLGAYIFAFLTVVLGWPVPGAMLAAIALTGIMSLLVGAVVTKVEGIFFIMITLAVGELGHEFFFKNATMGGDDGFGGIPRLDLSAIGIDLTDSGVLALVLVLISIVIYLLLSRLVLSPYGVALTGIHGNPQRMRSLGMPVRAYQTSAFALSGTIAGFAGVLAAQHTQFISPELMHWTVSGEVLVIVILGGISTLVGPLAGAIFLTLARHELSNYTDYWGFWLGLCLIAVVMGRKNGFVGWIEAGWNALQTRRNGKAVPHAAD